MRRWLSRIAVVICVLAGATAAWAQDALSVTIVGRGDDGFKELIAQFEKKTGRKVALRFPNFIESRDTMLASRASSQLSVPLGRIGSTM